MKESAGTLLYRRTEAGLLILLVHPSGNYNRHAPWSIPKGIAEAGESLEDAARRETFEETGVGPAGPLIQLGSIVYTKSRKRVHCFAAEASADSPSCASWEIDSAEFLEIEEGRRRVHPDQRPFLDRLVEHLGKI